MKRNQTSGFTLLELLLVVAIIGILAAIATPALQRARMAGNESSAIASLRAISTSQFMYGTSCASGYFAPGLSALGTPPVGGGQPFISPDLGYADVALKSGFSLTIGSTSGPNAWAPQSCNGVAAGAGLGGFFATATPAIGAGTRAFGVNGIGTIYWAPQMVPLAMTDTTAPAGAQPIPE